MEVTKENKRSKRVQRTETRLFLTAHGETTCIKSDNLFKYHLNECTSADEYSYKVKQ